MKKDIIDAETYESVKKAVQGFVYANGIAYSGIDPRTVVEDAVNQSVHDLIAYGIKGTVSKHAFDYTGLVKASYLFESSKNRILNELKSHEFAKAMKVLGGEEEQEGFYNKHFSQPSFANEISDYDVSYDSKHDSKLSQILEAVEMLDGDDRKMVKLMLDGYSDNEIAEELGIKRKSYKMTRLFERIKKAMKESIEYDDTLIFQIS